MKILPVFISVIFTAFSDSVFAQFPPLNFYKITNDEGLSQATVNVVFKDKVGFLWVGTDDGLNRFDGKKIKRYYHQYNDSNTLAANEVYGICEDDYNRIWIAHFNAGISIYDKNTNSFIRLENRFTARNRLASSRVYGVYKDKQGMIWARTVFGISKISPANFSIENYNDPRFADLNTVNIDIIDFAEHVWFGSKAKGLLRITKDGKTAPIGIWDNSKHGTSVTGIIQETARSLLFTSEKGLFRLRKQDAHIGIEPIAKDSVLFRSANKLFKQKNTPFVWIATEKGILVIDITQKTLVKHVKSESIKDNLISNLVNCLLQDDEQNIIIGTSRGINIASPYTSIFNNYENILRKINHFGHPVYAIHELPDGQLLLGTKSGGAYIFNPDSLKVVPIRIPYSPASEIKVYHFTPFINNDLVVCTSKGLWLLDLVNRRASAHRPAKFPELKQLENVSITNLTIADDSLAYIAGFTDGFFKWNYRRGTIKQYRRNEHLQWEGPVDNQVQKIAFSRNKHEIIVCTKFGFSLFYPAQDSFVNFRPGKRYPQELPARNIKDAWDDGENIWIATFGAGIQRLNKRTGLFSGLTTREGLPNNSVYAIIPDSKGYLWIPTNHGLALLNIQKSAVTTFTTGDGLPDNEFNGYASYKSPTGNLYFSTLNGIVQTRPEMLTSNSIRPKVVLTDLVASNSEQKDSVVNIYAASEIIIPAGFNSLFFEFASLSFAAPAKNQYRIMIENFDKDWIDLGNNNFRRYSNLPPGNYVLKLMGSNNSGRWSEQPLLLKIYVSPFWYQTRLFRTLLILSLSTLIFIAVRNYYIERLKEQKRSYEKQLAVQEERQRIGSEIHDDIGAGLMGVRLLTEMIGKRTSDGELNEEIKKIHSSISELSTKMREVIWSLNINNDTFESLLNYIQKQALQLFENSSINLITKLPAVICRFRNILTPWFRPS
ncbi:hypothetical protein EXU57_24610 [Segetibacter sp. 3557_3]|uniref:ligand-binding sensor domain-containing protein n=1 Tax=Segetibacter sp. 3557_3 TaxID=2547429 RepID=UPI001058FC7F|nr:two-component regulator propeller domain-containing protein [Segetibacter sp. 3557_3]TDH17909.1 hypothetical protein EXU57_24610 [Segetibacter sp. 3557_3]